MVGLGCIRRWKGKERIALEEVSGERQYSKETLGADEQTTNMR